MKARTLSYSHFVTFIVACLVLTGCKPTINTHITTPIPMGVVEPTRIPADSSFYHGLHSQMLIEFYKNNAGLPVWIGKDNTAKDSMLAAIRNALYFGLPPARYHVAELERLEADESLEAQIRTELLLTDSFFRLLKDVQYGVQSASDAGVDSVRIEQLKYSGTTGEINKLLRSVEPSYKDYHLLKHVLKATLDSLAGMPGNAAMQSRTRLISINLERWRRERTAFTNRYIFVNIPSYMLLFMENDSARLTSRVIVGKPATETPVLSSMLECFTLYPYWHVPRKISVNEYLPVIKKDTSFIRRNNFDVLDRKGNMLHPDSVKWSRFHENYFPVVLRQREGPDNSLGLVKFSFDNPYAVFLHDTNARRLFSRTDRAFSHGCIRMEKAIELAHYLATGVIGKQSKVVTQHLRDKKRYYMDLRQPVPIFVRYYTCEVRDNQFFAYKDVYGNDLELYDLLFGEFIGM